MRHRLSLAHFCFPTHIAWSVNRPIIFNVGFLSFARYVVLIAAARLLSGGWQQVPALGIGPDFGEDSCILGILCGAVELLLRHVLPVRLSLGVRRAAATFTFVFARHLGVLLHRTVFGGVDHGHSRIRCGAGMIRCGEIGMSIYVLTFEKNIH
ncbi:hypothetical protein D3C80_1600070 [compost metagenome]